MSSNSDAKVLWSSDKSKTSIGQPSSLPPDLVSASKADLARLHELRKMVQDDCDALLTQRDSLQRDVVLQQQQEQGSQSLDASFRFRAANNPSTSKNKAASSVSTSSSPSHALSSLARAYKVHTL